MRQPDTTLMPGQLGTTSLDPRDPALRSALTRRAPGGAYEVSDADVVRAIRAWDARGDTDAVRDLCELLVDRCMPEFKRRSMGLRHRPDLREDAIMAMIEQLLREVRNPREQFMLSNFIHYLHCLCADCFNRVLREEGLSYRRDERGQPAGRPKHVPRALVDRLDVPAAGESDDTASRDLPESGDAYRERLGALEAERILLFLSDPLDQKIVYLRVIEGMQWEEIATLCGKTERTMRLRFEKAKVTMRTHLEAEPHDD
jgi:DNA-directed RNA polymerase specialized sigma24 family protein